MEKKNKGLIIVIVILLLGLLCSIGYICYDKGVFGGNKKDANKDEKNTSELTPKTEDESVTLSDVKLENYINYINPVSIGPSEKLYNVSKVVASELTSREKIEYIGNNILMKEQGLTNEQYLNEGNGKYDAYILESDVKSIVEKVFGNNSYEKTIFNLGCGDYNLNESNGKYYTKTGCGGATQKIVSNTIIDYKATKSKLEITTAYVFFSGATNKIYKDYNLSIALDDYTDNGDAKSYLKDYIQKNKEKLNTIVYTFESKDGINYYFTELVNNK